MRFNYFTLLYFLNHAMIECLRDDMHYMYAHICI